MIGFIRERIQKIKDSKSFNDENCFKHQVAVENRRLSDRIEEITARINFVVSTTTSEHTVIYRVPEHDKKMFSLIKEYFMNLGFSVISLNIEDLGNEEYMIISWRSL